MMPADHAIPLLRPRALEAAFAWHAGTIVSAGRFLADAAALAERLPEGRYVLNLCTDRYRFATGFAAALLRGQISLLPPNHTPDLIARLAERYPGLYCLSDGAEAPASLHTLAYPDLSGAAVPTVMPEVAAAQVAAIVFTSGSTGEPMPNEKTWGALSRSAVAEASRLEVLDNNGLTVLGTVPPQHMYGFESTVLIAMQGGVMLHAAKPFYPADIATALEAVTGPRMLVTTPVHLRALLASEVVLPELEQIVCATAPLSRELALQAEERYATRLYEIYGFTEAGQVATRRTALTEEWRVFDGLALRQQDDAVRVSGGHVTGEQSLGDIAELRDATTFLLHGRKSDMINIAGKRTSLASLNHHLGAIPGVQDGVFFMPDASEGETTRLAAFVVAPGLDAAQIMGALRQCIDPVFLPRPLVFMDALPRNATGKLPRASLESLLRQGQRETAR